MIQIQNSDYNQNPQKSQSHLSQSTQLILLLVAEPLHPKCCVLFNLFFMMLCRKNSIKSGSGSVPVHLNVYDLTSINGYAYWLGLGVYHSGVQVHGIEYAFGAHEYPTTGIFEGEPKQCDGFTFRKAILIGWTEMGLAEVRGVMEELSKVYKGNAYNLITKNCNHFCNDACIRLTSNAIPSWVNRLARIGMFCNCIIPVSLNSTKVRHHRIEDKVCEGDKKKLRSGSKRFTSSSNSSSSSSSSPPKATRSSSRKKHSVLPSSPLIVGPPSS
ncbi:unnamed protein product [Camellia sinensis]